MVALFAESGRNAVLRRFLTEKRRFSKVAAFLFLPQRSIRSPTPAKAVEDNLVSKNRNPTFNAMKPAPKVGFELIPSRKEATSS